MQAVRRLVVLDALLLFGIAAAILAVQVLDRPASQLDASVRRYAAAVTRRDLDAALAELAPLERERWRAWIAGQLGNIYDVRGVAVRTPSLLDRVTRRLPGSPQSVTVVLDVNRGYPSEFYQPTTTVRIEQEQGRWYLAEPLLAPEATL
jgi:hypothetical protein